ncbi:dTDP-4-keto-6-deoxy-D-glucose epimerase [bacterium]|nr:MAG: dTDP-4-keto-6-deoxy-D-glucose epimerase [bacterium]
MQIISTLISGLFLFKLNTFFDKRGSFVKVYNDEYFQKHGLNFHIRENYYTVSAKYVIRGMHFQIPPHDHEKLVCVTKGKIIDVILDIRKKSKTYGKYLSYELSDINELCVFIPKGCAHGFRSLEDDTYVTYMQSTCYYLESDKGIRYNSFGFDWECENPIISKRDLNFPIFDNLITPF